MSCTAISASLNARPGWGNSRIFVTLQRTVSWFTTVLEVRMNVLSSAEALTLSRVLFPGAAKSTTFLPVRSSTIAKSWVEWSWLITA